MNVDVSVKRELFKFGSFEQWVAKASSWYKNRTPVGSSMGTIAVDAMGRVCYSGTEFMRADREKSYPITVYEV